LSESIDQHLHPNLQKKIRKKDTTHPQNEIESLLFFLKEYPEEMESHEDLKQGFR
jgi:hypothetical protein